RGNAKDPAVAAGSSHCSPDGIRTRVTALRGRRPRPLDDGAGTVCSGLGGEDSYPPRQDQNLLCCRLHHPRRKRHGTESGDEPPYPVRAPGEPSEPEDATGGHPERLAHESTPFLESGDRARPRRGGHGVESELVGDGSDAERVERVRDEHHLLLTAVPEHAGG